MITIKLFKHSTSNVLIRFLIAIFNYDLVLNTFDIITNVSIWSFFSYYKKCFSVISIIVSSFTPSVSKNPYESINLYSLNYSNLGLSEEIGIIP